ncbi:MAG: hypothetical protein ACI9IJ_001654, partial [Psychromonas sp.]
TRRKPLGVACETAAGLAKESVNWQTKNAGIACFLLLMTPVVILCL